MLAHERLHASKRSRGASWYVSAAAGGRLAQHAFLAQHVLCLPKTQAAQPQLDLHSLPTPTNYLEAYPAVKSLLQQFK